MPYKIALLPGDGIGPEVCTQAVKILEKIAKKFSINLEIKKGLIGGVAYQKHQTHFPDATATLCDRSDAVLFGSVGGPVSAQAELQWKDCEKNSILAIRKYLGLSVNLRPAPVYTSLSSFCPLKKSIIGDNNFEILVIRELSGGIYFGAHERPDENTARDEAIYDRQTIEKIAQFAFEAAHKRQKKLTSVDKANVLETSRLWREVFEAKHKDFPDVEFQSLYVDNVVQMLVKNPRQFDVLACPNLFGDIVSDLTSILPGSLGLLGSASFGKKIHLYEPSGGSAPDIAGKNIANPIAQILSVAMMLRYSFGEIKAADRIDKAVSQTLEEGYRTEDIYDKNNLKNKLVSTQAMGDQICQYL
jgi:3-isopropylmalate dehydrogenase